MRHNVTLYDTLGLEQDATDKEIRAGFRKLALKHHPDRFPDNERDAAEKKFQSMTEAFNVLSRPDSREEYDKEISKGTDVKAMPPKEIARRLAAIGSQLMSEGNMAEALEHLKGAIDHDDKNARAHYFYGQVLGRIPGKKTRSLAACRNGGQTRARQCDCDRRGSGGISRRRHEGTGDTPC